MRKNLLMLVMITALLSGMATAVNLETHPQTGVYTGWKIGPQAWSFNRFTLFEAIEKTRLLGLDYIQAYPGQRISKEITAGFGPDMSAFF